jgi:hypothetical protein
MPSTKRLVVFGSVAVALVAPVSAAASAAPSKGPKASAARVQSHRVLVKRNVRLANREAKLSGRHLRRGYQHSINTWSNERLRAREARLRASIASLRRYAGLPAPDPALRAKLARIAQCESGGNPRAVGGGGSYFGLFQFDYGTWAGVGGNGSPAAAPAEEQYRRAALLYHRRGSSPWPVCGSR